MWVSYTSVEAVALAQETGVLGMQTLQSLVESLIKCQNYPVTTQVLLPVG